MHPRTEFEGADRDVHDQGGQVTDSYYSQVARCQDSQLDTNGDVLLTVN